MTEKPSLFVVGTTGTPGTEQLERSAHESAHRIIALVNGGETVVDADLHEQLSQHRWRGLTIKGGKTYVVRHAGGKTIYMHREIMGAEKGEVVDHIDGDSLMNVRTNMRLCQQKDNVRAQTARNRRGTSKYKGVSWDKKAKKWQASIGHNYRTIRIGWFHDEHEAAMAYNRKAVELYGEFAKPNEVRNDVR